jgi:hypothetical protein
MMICKQMGCERQFREIWMSGEFTD